jgi:tetratricopeptide (TPR) repeat protein
MNDLGLARLLRGLWGEEGKKPAPASKRTAKPRTSARSSTPSPADEAASRAAYAALLSGLTHCEARRFEKALDGFQEAFIAFRLLGDRRNTALTQKTIALVISCIREPNDVRKAYERAAQMLRQAGLHDEEARTLLRAADFEAEQRAFTAAYGLFKRAVALCRDEGDLPGEIDALGRYATVEAHRGKVSEATKMLEEACTRAAAADRDPLRQSAAGWYERVLGSPPPEELAEAS